ncbi:MAG: OmpH family outer membrane protein [Saprospiraceae bacterium]|nr:OmpH family outer membrane protein [Saprospiraceae bacterium]
MKVSLLLCTGFMTLFIWNLNAQKVGHVNSVQLIDSLKEAKQASMALKQYEQSLAKAGEDMLVSFQQKLKAFQDEVKKGSLTTNQQKQKESELEVDQNAIVNYRESMRSSLDKKRQELVKPILEKINTALKAIGVDEQYQFIFDSSVGMLYFTESENLFSKVFNKLEPKN